MKTSLTLYDHSLSLYQYPKAQQHKSWQAWDSADEYLIQYVNDNDLITANTSLAIFNDDFGCLGCWFNPNDMHSRAKEVLWFSDSYISLKSLEQNLDDNMLARQNIQCMRSIDKPEKELDLVLIKIPKTNALLEQQLIDLQSSVTERTIIVAAGKVQSVHKSTIALFEKYLGPTTTSLAKKKSRLIFCQPEGNRAHQSPYPTTWQQESSPFTIHNLANVFSRQQLDIGARFFLQHLPSCDNLDVIDLGCGNGVIGLNLLSKNQPQSVSFVDESTMAIESAKLNLEFNVPESIKLASFTTSNCLSHIKQPCADLVLCNPPFHQQNTITEHIAKQMFVDAKRSLRTRGELRIVCNRHLGYFNFIKKQFGNCRIIASNKKFSILSAIKKG
jgi:16S rRNA (guanine1207-N2)-methyltransferase/23S rRNA (guanine1835-N2)-methyltransferase